MILLGVPLRLPPDLVRFGIYFFLFWSRHHEGSHQGLHGRINACFDQDRTSKADTSYNLSNDGRWPGSSNLQNLKTQCSFKLAELVETHRLAVKEAGDTDEIVEEFSQIKQRDMDQDGKLKIVGKDEVKEELGRSPDTTDTFVMRMYFELLRDATGGTAEQSVSAINRRMGFTREVEQRGY